ncbi:MAG TPA: BatD family protein [Nannocystaceae bacterium]|nr:BatD family protein [Nannocystaceae bacterium]
MRSRRRFLVLTGAALLVPATARADGLTATVRTDRTDMQVGDELTIELEVERAGTGRVPEVKIPEALSEGFEITQRMQSGGGFRISFGTGGSSRTVNDSMTLVAVALKPGKFKLSFTVDDAGTKVTSNVVEITVTGEAKPADATPIAAASKPTVARGDVFVWAATDKTTAYVGEQLEYNLDVYERTMLSSVSMRTPPSFTDFYTYDLPEGEARIEEIAGTPYRVRPGMRRALFPQKAGTLTIGAPEITIGRRRRDRGAALAVEVKPLPAEGQPQRFSPNNVGRYTISAKVDRNKVAAGQPLTWTIEIAGEGNIALVDPGTWPELRGARRYEPKVETHTEANERVGGRRTYAFLVIPEHGGALELPAVQLDYFDPLLERYEVARAEPITIEVEGGTELPPEPLAEATDDDASREQLAPIVELATVPREPPPQRWLTPRRWLQLMLVVPGSAIALEGGRAIWRRFGPDDEAKRRAREKQRKRERIEAARAAVDSGEGFHATIAGLLHELAVARTNGEGTGLPRPELVRMLGTHGVPAGDLRKLEALLDRCDAARFAAQRGTAEERRDLLDDALALVERSDLARSGT